MNLVTFLKQQTGKYRSNTFLHGEDGRVLSYQDFDAITDRMASGLQKLGVSPGDRVSVLHPNHIETLLAYYAVIKAGGIVVPTNSMYTASEIKFIVNNSEAKILITQERFSSVIDGLRKEMPGVSHVIVRKDNETLEQSIQAIAGAPLSAVEPPSLQPDDLAFLIYTSGTTGNPKGVMLSHRSVCFGGPNMAQTYALRDDDVTVACLPMCHIYSIASVFFAPLSSGGSIVVVERFHPQKILETIEKYKVTWFPGVPTMFIYLLNAIPAANRDLSSLRMGLCGGASLPVEILNKWDEMTKARILEVYGLTESTGLVTANPVHGVRKAGSIGINASGVNAMVVDRNGMEVKAGEIGELIFKGPIATKGYFHLPEETKEKIKNGWVYTGDHAYRDEDGYFYIVGRDKELIISGGYNIYPREIEEVLQGHDAVLEVAVVGVSDSFKGEVPRAYVTLKEGVRVTEDDLVNHCGKNLARYKVPQIRFIKELPKNQTGKIMKKELPRT